MAHLDTVRVHPIKSLDAVTRSSADVVEGGGLDWDRRHAIVDSDGGYVNGKRERRVHRLRTTFDLERETVTLRIHGETDETTYHVTDDREALLEWLSAFFDRDVTLVREDAGGFPDDTDAAGPTVIARATLDAVASWYDDIDASELCRRLRPNLVVDGVPAFWEDRLYGEPGTVRRFSIGDVEFHGVNPCQRCVVPTRDPDTGESTDGFREIFVERRRETLPPWATKAWFDHYFRLMVNTRVPDSSWGRSLEVGDGVQIHGTVSETTT